MFIKTPRFREKTKDVVLDLNLIYERYPYAWQSSHSQISEPLKLVVGLLKFAGNSSVSCKRISSGHKNQPDRIIFETNWSSWTTIASGALALFSMSIWLLFLINIGFETPFLITWVISFKDIENLLRDETSDKSMLGMVKKTYIVTAVVAVLQIYSRWAYADELVILLNAWHDFEKLIARNFPPYEYEYNFGVIAQYRDFFLLWYVVYPSMIVVPTFLCVYCSRLQVYAQFFATIMFFQLIPLSLLEDVKMFLTYKGLALAFSQVRRCIEQHSEMKKPVGAAEAQSWRLLVIKIRAQVHRASECHRFEELVHILGSISLVTIGMYVILNGWEDAQARGDLLFLMSMAGLCTLLTGRMFCKAYIAEQITTEEANLARTISALNSSNMDAASILELKCVADAVSIKPAHINFGNYVILNKRLLLKVFSQVVTYLIVLMQFNQPNKQQNWM